MQANYTYDIFTLFHFKQREWKASDMDCDTDLQFRGMGDRLQQSPTSDSWQKWQQDSATKLLQLRVLWGVFNRLQIDDDSADLHTILQSVQISWEQSQQSPKSTCDMKIRTAHGSYIIEMEVRVYPPKINSTGKHVIMTWLRISIW